MVVCFLCWLVGWLVGFVCFVRSVAVVDVVAGGGDAASVFCGVSISGGNGSRSDCGSGSGGGSAGVVF